jgi:hypothetical protein
MPEPDEPPEFEWTNEDHEVSEALRTYLADEPPPWEIEDEDEAEDQPDAP